MSKLTSKLLAIIIAFFCIAQSARAQQVLYGIDWNTLELLTINTTTGAGTVVGTLAGPFGNPLGLAFRGGALYTSDGGGTVRQINPANAATIATINIGGPPLGNGDMTFRSDGIGFMTSGGPFPAGTMIRFDITVPSATLIGPISPTIDGLAFDAAGVLWGLSHCPQRLYTINPATGAVTLVGNTGLCGGTAGLAFDASGTLYAGIQGSNLYRLNTATGAATLIGPIGTAQISGLAFSPGGPPPAGVTITQSGSSTDVTEGGATDNYTVVLNTAPTANVTITVNPGTQLTVAPAVLTFTPANWNVAQTITVTAFDDAVYEGPHTGTITHAAASADAAYNGVIIANVVANITDNDSPPPPGGGGGSSGGEGSFFGSGFFGFGGGISRPRARTTTITSPILRGPLADGSNFRVLNVAHRPRPTTQADASTDSGFGTLGWSLVLVLGGGVLLLIKKTGFA